MNVRYKPVWWFGIALLAILSGCVKDNQDDTDCPDEPGEERVRGIEVSFYSGTACETTTTYPEEIRDLLIGIFDRQGLLITHQEATDVVLNAEYFQQIEVESGLYTVIAWSGLTEELYEVNELQDSITTRDDLLFRIKRSDNEAVSIQGSRIFFGESAAVYVPENNSAGTTWEEVSVNMQEITNRIVVTVEGLNRPDDFEILIEAGNTSMNINGTIAQDEILQYIPVYAEEENTLEASFTLLKLETGYNNTITVRHRESGINLFSGSLLGALLLMNPHVNLACDHDFTIRFVIDDTCQCGTYAITEIWINNWRLHSYDTQM